MAGRVPAIVLPAAKEDRRNKPGDDAKKASTPMMHTHQSDMPSPSPTQEPAFAGSLFQNTISEYAIFYHIERALSRTFFQY
ncbi:MAG: hypothetical protein IOC82_17055 [Aestuariivirga sp.]|nr:hypothetical protein [Aestuariivirga sp.]